MSFRHCEQDVHNPPRQVSEVGRALRKRERGQPIQHEVEDLRRKTLAQPGLIIRGAHTVDDVVPESGRGQQLGDHLRRMLQIGIERDDCIAVCRRQAGSEGELVAEVPGQANSADSRVIVGRLQDHLPGVVGRAVVDKHQLGRPLELVEHGSHSPDENRQSGRLVEGWRDDTQVHYTVV